MPPLTLLSRSVDISLSVSGHDERGVIGVGLSGSGLGFVHSVGGSGGLGDTLTSCELGRVVGASGSGAESSHLLGALGGTGSSSVGDTGGTLGFGNETGMLALGVASSESGTIDGREVGSLVSSSLSDGVLGSSGGGSSGRAGLTGGSVGLVGSFGGGESKDKLSSEKILGSKSGGSVGGLGGLGSEPSLDGSVSSGHEGVGTSSMVSGLGEERVPCGFGVEGSGEVHTVFDVGVGIGGGTGLGGDGDGGEGKGESHDA